MVRGFDNVLQPAASDVEGCVHRHGGVLALRLDFEVIRARFD
jgi:hypothetical protein